ncbi:MAG TPA: S8 family peptidase [Tepidisphaeraceae bacterium]|nr:S8 family peptidase [Tepidisphaeraceae bacterium]
MAKSRHTPAPTPSPRAPLSDFELLESRQLLSAAVAPIVNAVWNGNNVQVVQGQYVVEFRSGVNVKQLANSSKFTQLKQISNSDLFSLTSGKSIKQMQTWAAANPHSVVAITPNVITHVADIALPNDPLINDQWQYDNTGQIVPDPALDPTGQTGYFFGSQAGTPGDDISADKAWTIVNGDPNTNDPTKQIVVAVLDTGIDLTHPDLVNEIWHNPKEIAGNNFDDDGDGFVDDVNGWNFVSNNNDVMDDFGHGTHVSGIIGAQGNNGIGVSGVIQNVKILPVKVGDSQGRLTTVDIIEGMEYITTLKNEGVNIVVANGSFGGTDFPFNRVENDAISRMGQAGILFTVAAGNDAADTDPSQSFPAKFSLNQSNVITVAATDNQDHIAFFSNIGATSVSIAAPGLNILSTFPTYDVGTLLETGEIVPSNALDYGYDSGTSMAAPMVAGAIALMKAADPSATMMQLKTALLAGADHIPSLDKSVTGGTPLVSTAGRLDVYKAILNLLNQRTNVDTSTQGSWTGVYGKQGAVVYGDNASINTYSNSFVNAQITGASLQVYSDTSSNPNALQQQTNHNSRIAAQLSSAGPITLDLDFSDSNSHRVSLYLASLTKGISGPLNISLIDPDTGTLINSYNTGNLKTGEYDTFEVSPPQTSDGSFASSYRIRIVISPTKAGQNAVLNGLFFDPGTTDDAALVTATPVANIKTVTGGDWTTQYGSRGADVFGGVSTTGIVSLKSGTIVKLPQYNSSSAALVQPRATSTSQRAAGYVQTKGSMDIIINLNSFGSPQKLTIYAADLEKLGRAERLDLYNADTGALLTSVDLKNFSAGKYVSFIVSGKVRLHVTRLAGPNAVIGGIFIDAAPGSPVEYVGMDTTSSGNWKTFYGADGAVVFGSPAAPARRNSYTVGLTYGGSSAVAGDGAQSATVKVTNGSNGVPFVQTTDDSRFPLLPAALTNLSVNNPKTTGTSMNVDLKFTDQREHTVALYMVDPDKNNSRAQKVELQVYNPATGKYFTVATQIVSSFSHGKYLVFNVHQTATAAPADVRVKITRVAGGSAVINGVFFG